MKISLNFVTFQFHTSCTKMIAGWCGNIVSLGVVALVAVIEQEILELRPLVFLADSLKST